MPKHTKKAKNSKLAAMYGDKKKITRGDIIMAIRKKKEKKQQIDERHNQW